VQKSNTRPKPEETEEKTVGEGMSWWRLSSVSELEFETDLLLIRNPSYPKKAMIGFCQVILSLNLPAR